MPEIPVKLPDGTTINAHIPEGERLWSQKPPEFGAPYLMRYVPRDGGYCCFSHGVFLYRGGPGIWYRLDNEPRRDDLVFVSYSSTPSYFIGHLEHAICSVDGEIKSTFELPECYQVAPPYDGHAYWARRDILESHLKHDGQPVPPRKKAPSEHVDTLDDTGSLPDPTATLKEKIKERLKIKPAWAKNIPRGSTLGDLRKACEEIVGKEKTYPQDVIFVDAIFKDL